MITHLELELKFPENEKFRANWAYALYGELCSRMPPRLADELHEQNISPVRQHLRRGAAPDQCTWVLDLFGDAAELAGLIREWKQIELNCWEAPLSVERCKEEKVTMSDLLQRARGWPGNAPAEMTFESPCTFKVAGEYVLFPTTDLIVQSLFSRWNALIPDCSLDDADALQMLASGLRFRRYRLSSRDYRMKGQRIPGFVGTVQIAAHLPTAMLELWRLLLAFAPYSGVGVKPALGMGAVQIRPHTRIVADPALSTDMENDR